ncbi:3-deoxy-D-manno-octulosonic acid kinase [Photobacterium sp. 1_MG-2023]|uniref:3-deoxy-D-manno-octulosonic acid kinase n=1 Tax=Photobacterium sp. 1_MG-2023 TaxID=3062646 RepID=UPI0026E2F448|nr:3-deoxy-D-manno-octulosonic acid kinase [Photobacterium sp. 1_MG-2023]MDO6706288.1 3-deoxy-D-manno-octulosonic acid kinase [Photobacterium sp. 1_MG-2023]
MEIREQDNCRVMFDPDLLQEDPWQCFEPDFWQAQQAVIGSARGRGTTWFVRGTRLDMALRHYYRGGLFGKLVKDQYWFSDWASCRSIAEFNLLQHLVTQGVRVPRPVAARVCRTGLYYRADLLTEKVPEATDLVDRLQQGPLTDTQWQAVGAMIRKMHDSQVNHTDLNAHNILLDAQAQIWLIDFDKCAVEAGEPWKAENLSRLHRSFVKEVDKAGIHWQEADWQALLAGYQ